MTHDARFETERHVLALLLQGVDPTPIHQYDADLFSYPLHGRLFARLKAMTEQSEPIDVVTAISTMTLGQLEQVELGALLDPLFQARHNAVEVLRANLHTLNRAARERDLRKVCDDIAQANGDIIGQVVELEQRITRYIKSLTASETADNFFDSFEAFEKAPPISFSIKGFLQNEAITAIAGLSGHGKTWIALSMIRALLFGPGKLWNWFEVPERAAHAVYLIPESSRGPIKDRLKVMELYDEIRTGRLLIRTLNMGKTPSLADPQLLRAVKNATVILDTGIRFMKVRDEANATEIAEGLSNDMLGLLRAEAKSVIPLFHSPKSFLREATMTLEGMIRGSSELGAVLATAWGIKQLDRMLNVIHVQNLKPRDFEPCGPFQLAGRPYIDKDGDLVMLKTPDKCGFLADEQPELNRTNADAHQARAANIELVRGWLEKEPELTAQEMRERFARLKIEVSDSTVRGYKHAVKRGMSNEAF